MSKSIDLATLVPGWQRRSDTVTSGVPIYRGVLRTPRGRIIYWTCSDDHAFTKTAKTCAQTHLDGLIDRTVAHNGDGAGEEIEL